MPTLFIPCAREPDPFKPSPKPQPPPKPPPPKPHLPTQSGQTSSDGRPVDGIEEHRSKVANVAEGVRPSNQEKKSSNSALGVKTNEQAAMKKDVATRTREKERNHDQSVKDSVEDPLSPPDPSPAAVIANLELGSHLSNLKRLIGMYEDFDKTCRGTSVYAPLAWELIDEIRRILFLIAHVYHKNQSAIDAADDPADSAGTMTVLSVTHEVICIHNEASTVSQSRAPERNAEKLRDWVLMYYVGRMMAVLLQIDELQGASQAKKEQSALELFWKLRANSGKKENGVDKH